MTKTFKTKFLKSCHNEIRNKIKKEQAKRKKGRKKKKEEMQNASPQHRCKKTCTWHIPTTQHICWRKFKSHTMILKMNKAPRTKEVG